MHTYSDDRCTKGDIKAELRRMAEAIEWGSEWAHIYPMVRSPSDRTERAKVIIIITTTIIIMMMIIIMPRCDASE